MGYYDSVKDSVKDQESSSDSNKKGGGFDTLKKNAEKDNEQEEDDTPIEVIDEGLSESSPQKKKERESSNNSGSGSGFPPANEDSGSRERSVDSSCLEDKLDTIIEQNERMIEILESFGN